MTITLLERFESHVDRSAGSTECHLWTSFVNRGGYGRISIPGRSPQLAHRVAWELAHGPIPAGLFIRHRVCDNPPCVNLLHLAPGTAADNMADMIEHGRLHLIRRTVLTAAQVAEIRARSAAGETGYRIAKSYPVTQSVVYDILRGESWK